MWFSGLKNILKIHLQLQLGLLRWRYLGVIMKVGGENESNKYF
jgi:hypothetical protein